MNHPTDAEAGPNRGRGSLPGLRRQVGAITPLAFLLLAAASVAAAPPSQSRPPVTAGLGVVASPSPYAGVEEPPVTAVPFINLELDRFYLRGLEAGYGLMNTGRLSVSAILQPRMQSYKASESPALGGMASRRRTAEGGFRAQLKKGRLQVGLRAVSDLLGRHHGQVVTGDIAARFGGPRLTLEPSAGIQWQSPDFVTYYYGVRPEETRTGRPAYDAGAAANPFLGASARLRLGKRWGVFALVRHYWLDESVTASPIVDSRTDHSGVLAVTRAFGR